jgi:hypothetical protein
MAKNWQGGQSAAFNFVWNYPDDKPMAKNWQGGQSAARRMHGLPINGAHGVTRPAHIVCEPDNLNFVGLWHLLLRGWHEIAA